MAEGVCSSFCVLEIKLLSRIRHKNLVGLIGYCAEAGQRVLVYEYVSKGSLLEYIVGKGRAVRLPPPS